MKDFFFLVKGSRKFGKILPKNLLLEINEKLRKFTTDFPKYLFFEIFEDLE